MLVFSGELGLIKRETCNLWTFFDEYSRSKNSRYYFTSDYDTCIEPFSSLARTYENEASKNERDEKNEFYVKTDYSRLCFAKPELQILDDENEKRE